MSRQDLLKGREDRELKAEAICDTPGCVLAGKSFHKTFLCPCYSCFNLPLAADLLKNMDKKVNPCDDFYSFACGGFEERLNIPDDKSSMTTFSLISDQVTEQLRNLVEKPIIEDEAEPFKLVKKLYQSCLNKSKRSPSLLRFA